MNTQSGKPCRSTGIGRRDLIRIGTLGVFGVSLPRLLWADSQGNSSAKSCIFLVLSGGPSHIDTWDPKPDAPRELRGPYQAISTATPGVQLTDRFPLLAQLSGRYCLVRSLSHSDSVHVSDKTGGHVAAGRPVSHEDFGATLLSALGIPPETRYGPDGFSFRASGGQPVVELFA